MRRSLLLAAAALAAVPVAPATAEEVAATDSHWAQASFIDSKQKERATIRIEAVRSQQISLEDAQPSEVVSKQVCFAGRAGMFAFDACSDDLSMNVNDQGAYAEGTVPVVLTFRGVPIWTESVTIHMTFVDTGMAAMPGLETWATPELRAGTSWSFQKEADVVGSIISPALGSFPFDGVPGRLGHSHGFMLGTSWSADAGDGTSW